MKQHIKKLVEEGKSSRDIACIIGKGQTTVCYWIKKLNLKLKRKREAHCCYLCGETNPNNFYGYKKHICRNCHNNYTASKGIEKRKFALDFLGGKCIICGFDEYIGSLDLHHINKNKDPNFKSLRGWNKDRILKEIKNCIILCRNHHSMVHAGLIKLDRCVAQSEECLPLEQKVPRSTRGTPIKTGI